MRIFLEIDLEKKLTKEELEKLNEKATAQGIPPEEVAAGFVRAGLTRSRRPTKKGRVA